MDTLHNKGALPSLHSTLTGSSTAWILAFLSSYVLIANLLRFSRVRYMQQKYGYGDRKPFSSMTIEDAQQIQLYVLNREFPFLTEKALEFALFRTYGIPTISKLLMQTKEISAKSTALKRINDTALLIVEFVNQPVGSPRHIDAVARMNQIHKLYQDSGRISNDDMLYTLSTFTLEPLRWVRRHEWRELTEMERCAIGVFWHTIGDSMNIDFSPLPSSPNWRDGLHWWDEMEEWSVDYEKRYMVPAETNKQTAERTTKMLLYTMPTPLHGLGTHVVSTLMDDRLRKAMMYPSPPAWVPLLLNTILTLRKYALRFLALPRPYFLRSRITSEEPDPMTGRLHKVTYVSEPWYVPGSFTQRWNLQAWKFWLLGKPIPGDPGFQSEGYIIREVGPKGIKSGAGFEEQKRMLADMKKDGCPMAFGR